MSDSFTQWCREELFTPAVAEANRLQNRYCDLRLIDMVRRLDLAERLTQPKTGAELASELGYVASADATLEAALRRLAARTDVVRMDPDHAPPRFTAGAEPPDVSAELDAVRKAMGEVGEQFLPSLEFIDFGAQNFERCIKDDPELMDRMLSGRDPEFEDLWFRATNVDPLQDLHGRMGAVAIAELFKGGDILEIGGGTGNGVRHILREFKAREILDRVGTYVFTDISTRFVLTTRKEMKRDYPDVKFDWKGLDINRKFAEQRFAPASFDLIYAVNAAHVAKDIVAFLKDCKAALRPGGRVMFAERIRYEPLMMAPREFTLNLSIYHRSATKRSDDRPIHCYLSPSSWAAVLEQAGFANGRLIPDVDALGDFPDPYAAVVVGEA